jgi:flagellar protein FlaG
LLIRSLDAASPSPATAVGGVAVAATGRDAVSQAAAVALPTRAEVIAAATTANAELATREAALEFKVDPDTRQVIVRLVDPQDNRVLRQVPTPEMLEIAKSIDRMQLTLLRNQA